MAFDINDSPFHSMQWFIAIVEDIVDPLKIDRIRVRCVGFHTDDRSKIDTDQLPWAPCLNTGNRMGGPMFLPGNMVVGFFLDGKEARQPVIIGAMTGIPIERRSPKVGFSDPDNIYPKNLSVPDSPENAWKGTPDNVTYQKNSVATGVGFDEPATPFAPVYPKNHVIKTDGGQIFELDDTIGAERISIFHKSGSFIEMHPDGKVVYRSLSDRYDVTFADHNIYISGDAKISVGGSTTINSTGDLNLNSSADVSINAMGAFNVQAAEISILGATAAVLSSGGETILDGSAVDIMPGSGGAGAPNVTKVPALHRDPF